MDLDFPFQLMPDLSEIEFAALKEDIAERGVMLPVEIDERGNILDGHHRWRACLELDISCPTVVRAGWSDLEKRTHARRMNIVRRHLSREQKRWVIADELFDNPQSSNNAIAKLLSVSDNTVDSVRKEIGADSDVRVGADGKSYSAVGERVSVHTQMITFRTRDELLEFRTWLRRLKSQHGGTFGDAVTIEIQDGTT